jgi:hypothetical protein
VIWPSGFGAILNNKKFADLLTPGKCVNVSIALENFQLAKGETKDFRVNYAFAFNYYDTTPESFTSVLGFSVKQGFDVRNLCAERGTG